MEYNGKFKAFDFSRIRTHSLAERRHKVHARDLMTPAQAIDRAHSEPARREHVAAAALAIAEARAAGRPIVWFTGAHIVKNGFGLLLRDLIQRDAITLLAMNSAAFIHDLELALIGETSEDVPESLPQGRFGFAEETGCMMNAAFAEGQRRKVGAGEMLGDLVCGGGPDGVGGLPHKHLSVVAAAWEAGIPAVIHASIGTDVIDQHPAFDGAAKGACAARDFAIYCAEIERMHDAGGGVAINIGSSVAGPEALLKACSMAANIGKPPRGIVTVNLDIRAAHLGDATNERAQAYYYRDIKTVVVRIPEAFQGRGYYIEGDHIKTIPALYAEIVTALA